MKGAYLLAKHTDFYNKFSAYIKTLGYSFNEAANSIRLNACELSYFTCYDRIQNATFFEDNEIPTEAIEDGYIYGYLVECRDEELFCRIVRSAGEQLDFVVCDGNGAILQPRQIAPGLITL